MTARWPTQARALLALRVLLWWRRFVRDRQWGRAVAGLMGAGMGAFVSASLCALVLTAAAELQRDPARLQARGGPLMLFAAWATLSLLARVWFGLLSLAQQQGFLDPRRLRPFPVSERLVSAINLMALLFDPVWLLLYPPLFCIALAVARLPGAPAAASMLVAEALAVWATAGLLHLGAAIAALFDARPALRRGFSVVLLIAGVVGFQLSVALPTQQGISELFAHRHGALLAWTPPGWMAQVAGRLSGGAPLRALAPALLLAALGLGGSAAAHALSRRELRRPPETGRAAVARGAGWSLPLVPARFSALLEKEARTALRIGWLQLVIVPVAYLLLVRAVLPGPEPLLIAAVYAHLGVLEFTTNAFGRDAASARGWFLWPVAMRAVLLAKNVVAYGFSLAIFLLLALTAGFGGRITPGQFAVGLLAHAATFPLLATYGNVVSTWFPVPVRGGRLRRVRGAGPVGSRLTAMLLLAGAAWAPWALARLGVIQLYAAYAGELIALGVAYPALLGVAAHLIETRRELLIASLLRDE
ncbi:MAG TPA: hypothetical protein VFE90_25140 [Myxococcales bacterium]|nr:hypothetical protein [Myxococcales bacterium]